MDSDEQEHEGLRAAALKNVESIRIARQRAERELLIAKEAPERKTEELQQQRAWFEVTLASIRDAVITTDINAKITYLNPVAESMTGWSSTQARGRTTLTVPSDESAEAPRFIGIIEDITDRKRTEQDLNDARAQAHRIQSNLAAIVESSDDAIISKTLQGVISTWNQAAARIFGYTAEEVIGKPITLLIPPTHIDEEPLILQKLRRGERIDHYETVRKRKDGVLIHVSLTVSPIKDANGSIVGASKIARDITQRKRASRCALLPILCAYLKCFQTY